MHLFYFFLKGYPAMWPNEFLGNRSLGLTGGGGGVKQHNIALKNNKARKTSSNLVYGFKTG